MKKRIIIVLFMALLLVVGLLVYFGQRDVQLRELYYSGTIESKRSELAFQVSGRVTNVIVDEGQSVEKVLGSDPVLEGGLVHGGYPVDDPPVLGCR